MSLVQWSDHEYSGTVHCNGSGHTHSGVEYIMPHNEYGGTSPFRLMRAIERACTNLSACAICRTHEKSH